IKVYDIVVDTVISDAVITPVTKTISTNVYQSVMVVPSLLSHRVRMTVVVLPHTLNCVVSFVVEMLETHFHCVCITAIREMVRETLTNVKQSATKWRDVEFPKQIALCSIKYLLSYVK
ncbi:MEG-3 (Grail) family, partial [Schistosoma mansoni]|uniref:MEG-3 (Grail) family n=1 Tax=Schistosoma mansoni TaxID=6183 RepID=UPI00022C8217